MIIITIILLIILLLDNIKQYKCSISVPHPSFFPSVYNVKIKDKDKDKIKDKDKVKDEIVVCNSRHLPKKFLVRQVPGDGSCLFNAIAICVSHEFTKKVNIN